MLHHQLEHLGVLGVRERSLVSVLMDLSFLQPPCSSVFSACGVEGSRPDMKAMLCFRLSSLSWDTNRRPSVSDGKNEAWCGEDAAKRKMLLLPPPVESLQACFEKTPSSYSLHSIG